MGTDSQDDSYGGGGEGDGERGKGVEEVRCLVTD